MARKYSIEDFKDVKEFCSCGDCVPANFDCEIWDICSRCQKRVPEDIMDKFMKSFNGRT